MLYTPDERDTVFEEPHFPPPLSGAPLPTVFATEHRLLLAYYANLWQPEPRSNRRLNVPVLVNDTSLGVIAVVDFRRPAAFFSPYPGAFSDLKHLIFVFHDSIFEAAANEFEVRTVEGSMGDAQDEMLQSMRERAL
jgi:hypothetical protein